MQSDFGFNFDNSYARLPGILFSFQEPASLPAPQAVVINDELAEFLGLSPQALRSEAGTAVLAGNENPPGGLPLAQAYAGHQFGHFTMLVTAGRSSSVNRLPLPASAMTFS